VSTACPAAKVTPRDSSAVTAKKAFADAVKSEVETFSVLERNLSDGDITTLATVSTLAPSMSEKSMAASTIRSRTSHDFVVQYRSIAKNELESCENVEEAREPDGVVAVREGDVFSLAASMGTSTSAPSIHRVPSLQHIERKPMVSVFVSRCLLRIVDDRNRHDCNHACHQIYCALQVGIRRKDQQRHDCRSPRNLHLRKEACIKQREW
jgi:hypothetical protein